ncbi:hypothetical protein DFQ04_1906 [Algoriphagus boseongensis]|uniref:Lipoprotein n=1 Tax=Algoriphagus boseongensis TaxID=1442587 RepID=A0A4R6T5I8_9BACT|nr:hypothetical protein [Algoriphagus boseongensis]TDQ17254.1 hypothetical protein DFQ04_1906 [Algoriphagus boseongensis]
MKKSIFNLSGPILLLSTFLLFSCKEDDAPLNPEPAIGAFEDEVVVNSTFEDLDNVTIDVMQSSGLGLRTTGMTTLCAGATVNHDLNAKKITVNFGTTGCTGPQGNVRKGKIIFTYSGTNFLFPGTSIVATFEGYEVNGYKIEGRRTLTNSGVDLASSTITLAVKIENGKVTWPDNTFVTFNSDQVRKLKLGSTGYEASIAGTASGKSREGKDYSLAITQDLMVKQSCVTTGVYIPIAGILELTYQGIVISADYGAGNCDKKILITYPGGTREITAD